MTFGVSFFSDYIYILYMRRLTELLKIRMKPHSLEKLCLSCPKMKKHTLSTRQRLSSSVINFEFCQFHIDLSYNQSCPCSLKTLVPARMERFSLWAIVWVPLPVGVKAMINLCAASYLNYIWAISLENTYYGNQGRCLMVHVIYCCIWKAKWGDSACHLSKEERFVPL